MSDAYKTYKVNELEASLAKLQKENDQLQKELEQERRKSSNLNFNKELFESISSEAPLVLFSTDKKGVFTLSLGKGLERLGLKPGEAVGVSAFELYKGVTSIENGLNEALAGKEVVMLNQVGGIYFESMFRPIFDGNGEVSGIVGIAVDVSEKIQAQTERDYFYNTTLALLCTANMDGYFLDLNRSWPKTLGYTIEELKSKPFFEFVHPDDIESTYEALADLSRGETVINFENRYRCKDGTYKWLNWSTVYIGERIYCSAIDVSKTKKIELALKESEARFKAIFHSVNDAILVLAIDMSCLYANPAACTYFRLSCIPISGMPFNSLFDTENEVYLLWKKRFSEVIQTKTTMSFNDHSLIEGVLAYSQSVMSPIYDVDGKMFAVGVVLRDVSELEGKKVALERSNKELEQFAYISSHDLQEPLRKIKNYTDLLGRLIDSDVDENAQKYMERISHAVLRMQKLIDDLLSYSRLSTRKKPMGAVDLNHIVAEVLEILELHIYKTGAVVEYIDLPIVWGDKVQLRQLFQNLLSNALKFRSEAAPKISITAEYESDEKICLQVRDNGIGIAPEFSEKIFAVFQRLHSRDQYEGTGIGLAICQKIIERHGGRIWVESEFREGASFKFTLPLKLIENE